MKATAGKYLAVFHTQVKNLFEYKMNVYLKLVRPLVMVAAVGSLWLVLFSLTQRDRIGGLSRQGFLLYLLIIRYIAVFSPGSASISEMNEEIRTGNITMRLVRPIHYPLWLLVRNLPIPLFSGLIGLLAVMILAGLLGGMVPGGALGLLFALSVPATILAQYALYQGIGILSFWVYDVFPLERFYKTVSGILSGEMIPLTVFGGGIQAVLQYLPFASLAFIPGGIYTGLFSGRQAASLVACQYGWAALLWMLVLWMYRKGLQKYEAQGG
ncbi:MAG: ABC-2 family transporter protein [Sedimentisphaerales bacterium]|nr:ABC-2 family transporter protein [Sedimentisphaerales bacterium]